MIVGATACAHQAHARGNRVTCGGAGWWVAVLSLPRVGVGGVGYFDAGLEECGKREVIERVHVSLRKDGAKWM